MLSRDPVRRWFGKLRSADPVQPSSRAGLYDCCRSDRAAAARHPSRRHAARRTWPHPPLNFDDPEERQSVWELFGCFW